MKLFFNKDIVNYIPHLRRYARVLLKGNMNAADDLVQDCLERALKKFHLWQPEGNLRAWLFTMMHNIYVNQIRRDNNSPDMVPLDENAPHKAKSNAEINVMLHELQTALDDLPTDQREILLLVTIEGMRYQEVAEILDIPEGTVMSRLSRARKRLRAKLSGEGVQHLRRVK